MEARLLWIEADISACQSQQSSAVIWTVIRGSQRANHAIMEIRMIHTISYVSQGIYTLRSGLEGNGSRFNPEKL